MNPNHIQDKSWAKEDAQPIGRNYWSLVNR